MYAIEKPSYVIFEKGGKERDYNDLYKAALNADVILFGELHNNSLIHWLQFELLKDLNNELDSGSITIGAEMFESDDQLIIDEYLNGDIRLKDLEKEAKVWNNFPTDYSPLLEFASENSLKFIATNIPRRYASLVSRKGFDVLDTLSDEAKSYMCPLPVKTNLDLPSYKMMDQMGKGHGMDFIKNAQAIKDATMAHFINQNLNKLFIHYNGSYHSDSFEGIYWHLKDLNPDLRIVTISSKEQDDLKDLEEINKDVADFIILTPKSMTKTY